MIKQTVAVPEIETSPEREIASAAETDPVPETVSSPEPEQVTEIVPSPEADGLPRLLRNRLLIVSPAPRMMTAGVMTEPNGRFTTSNY